MNLPEVWMISISNNEISQHYRKLCQPTWEKCGFTVNHFEAITPNTMNQYEGLKFYKKIRKDKSTVEFTETEKAVWWSHFLLWKKCIELDTPIIVAEHDAELLKRPVPKLFREEVKFAFLCGIKRNNRTYMLPCGAYYITPRMARQVVTVSNQRWWHWDEDKYVDIHMNVDGWLRSKVDHYSRIDKEGLYRNWKQYSTQIIDPDIGTTIEHRKK